VTTNDLAAAAKRIQPRATLKLDDLREKRPAHGKPDRDGNQKPADAECETCCNREGETGEEGAKPAESDAVSGDRADRLAGVDAHQRAGSRSLDEHYP